MGWSRETLRQVAKRTGYPVVEAWSGHNAGTMGTVYGPVLHHTGTPSTVAGNYPTLKVVRDGRPGLVNSLCAYGIGRDGTIYLVNEKVSWHAGAGDWKGVTDGNGHFLGIEAEGPYPGAWPAAELDSYKKLVASILLETGRGFDWAPTHAQWANPAGRKTDPTSINMSAFRADVEGYLKNPDLLGGGEDMPLSDADIEKVAQRVRQVLADGTRPYGLAKLRSQLDKVLELLNKS